MWSIYILCIIFAPLKWACKFHTSNLYIFIYMVAPFFSSSLNNIIAIILCSLPFEMRTFLFWWRSHYAKEVMCVYLAQYATIPNANWCTQYCDIADKRVKVWKIKHSYNQNCVIKLAMSIIRSFQMDAFTSG